MPGAPARTHWVPDDPSSILTSYREPAAERILQTRHYLATHKRNSAFGAQEWEGTATPTTILTCVSTRPWKKDDKQWDKIANKKKKRGRDTINTDIYT